MEIFGGWKKRPGVELGRVRMEQSGASILLDLPVSGDRFELPPAVSLPEAVQQRLAELANQHPDLIGVLHGRSAK